MRGAVFSFVPSTINDVVIHHTPLTIGEVAHTVTDTISVGTMSTVIAVLTMASKVL